MFAASRFQICKLLLDLNISSLKNILRFVKILINMQKSVLSRMLDLGLIEYSQSTNLNLLKLFQSSSNFKKC